MQDNIIKYLNEFFKAVCTQKETVRSINEIESPVIYPAYILPDQVQCLAEGVRLGVSYAQECHDAYTPISKLHRGCQIEENVQVEQKPEALNLIVDRRTE